MRRGLSRDIFHANLDVVRLSVDAPDSGRVGLEEASALFSATRDLVLAAACSAHTRRAYFPHRKPPRAVEYVRKVRLAAPEAGSFVVVLESPVAPALSTVPARFDPVTEPFERTAVVMLATAGARVRQSISETTATGSLDRFADAVPVGVNANYCDALARLLEEGDGRNVTLSFAWAASRPIQGPTPSRVAFSRNEAEILRAAARYLKERAPIAGFELAGPIVRLESAAPATGGEVAIAGLVDDVIRQVVVSLGGEDYKLAMHAHQQELDLECPRRGTVFLDEIGELPAADQSSLLGVLERRRFRRVGGSSELDARARVIAATNRDLRAEVNTGRFRQDLYHRLAVVVLRLAPLRERREDIPVLVEHFARELGAAGSIESVFGAEQLAAWQKHPWQFPTVSVLLGNGDGTFQDKVDYATGGRPSLVAVGDLEGDGKLDLVVLGAGGQASVLRGKGDGTFGFHVEFPTLASPSAAGVVDITGDGKPDLLVVNPSGSVSVLRGDGHGALLAKIDYPTGSFPTAFATADIDRDGRLDVVTTNLNDGTISVLRGNTNGTLRTKVDYPVWTPRSRPASSLVVADVTGDGRLDAVVLNFDNNALSILAGNGDGTFQPRLDYLTRAMPSSLATADFNRDGLLDFALTNVTPGAGMVGVLLARCIR